MWLPTKAFNLFHISRESFDDLRRELAAAVVERDALRVQAAVAQSNFDWLRMRVNQLEVERAQLLKKAYNVDTVVPEVVRTSNQRANQASNLPELMASLFEDVGETQAKELGLPVYS